MVAAVGGVLYYLPLQEPGSKRPDAMLPSGQGRNEPVVFGLVCVAVIYHYTIILDREPDGGFHAFCPALKGCHSQGDTLDEATDNIREAIGAYLESVTAHGEPIPREDLLIKPLEIAI